ncbi:MAG: Asp-tRNA(Asn)/Glu-tRNA(Gln) amidotransferase subunit GatB, partial [Pyrinomonadaceae bacterium]
DLPKGYQITQYEDPIIVGGSVLIQIDTGPKTIGITRVHLEEDAGKNTHPAGADYSLVDLNRAGTPLLEIVSQPDISSPAEAKAFARELYLLMKYAGVSDVDLYHGNMRFDVNVSVSATDQPGKRAEVKNLNSFRSVENAVAFEIDRQIALYESGQTVVQETRGWDDDTQKTTGQRGKEEAHDYRYMPEPDIPPLELDQAFIDRIKDEMPQLPSEIRQILNLLSIEPKIIEDILDNETALKHLLASWDQQSYSEAARALSFIVLKYSDELKDIDAEAISRHLVELAEMRVANILSSTAADEVLETVIRDFSSLKEQSMREIAEKLNLIQLSDEGEIEKIVAEVLAQNQKAAEDIKNGEMKAIGFLVGQVMSRSQGKANPQITQKIIKKQLGL